MSIIFQTLKRLQQQSNQNSSKSVKGRKADTGFLGRLKRTPLGMGLFLAGIFAIGFVLLHGLEQLTHLNVEDSIKRPKPNDISHPVQQPELGPKQPGDVAVSSLKNNDNDPGKMSSPVFTAVEPNHDSFAQDALNDDEKMVGQGDVAFAREPEKVTLQFTPPNASSDTVSRGTKEMEDNVVSKEENKIWDETVYRPAKAVEENLESNFVAPGKGSNIASSSKVESFDNGKFDGQTAVKFDPSVKARMGDIQPEDEKKNLVAASDSFQNENFSEPKDSTAAFSLRSEQQQRLENLEKFHQAAKKRSVIADLVTELKGAMERFDEPKVDDMLNRLTGATGEDNIYTLNLKAYWLLKQQHYHQAEILLQQILVLDRDHLEAGINLAIVEAKTKRRKEALHRLEQLQELYPENAYLSGLIYKLR